MAGVALGGTCSQVGAFAMARGSQAWEPGLLAMGASNGEELVVAKRGRACELALLGAREVRAETRTSSRQPQLAL